MSVKKPTNVLQLAGTARPDRARSEAELPTLGDLPKPPTWLPNAHAVAEWKRLGPILVANRLLTEGGLSAFGMLCALHGKIVQLYAAGEAPTGHMVAQYRNLINDFGLTPVAQGKVKQVGDGPKANRFSGRGKKPAAA